MKQPVICLMGPTASGKTALSLRLAEYYPVEIISVDSTLVYQGMDIGSAKPSALELARCRHHLIDIRHPRDYYSVGDFTRDAQCKIAEIQKRAKLPLLVGGSMLYFKALQSGLAALPMRDESYRLQLAAVAAEKGWPYLHQQLQAIDAVSANTIQPNDRQRIARYLEIYHLTKQLPSVLFANSKAELPYHFINIALLPADRAQHRQLMAARFAAMLAQGLVEEVRHLQQQYQVSADCASQRSVGYRQVWRYLAGEYDLASLQTKASIATCQLAKRQLTWLRRWPQCHSLPVAAAENHDKVVARCVQLLDSCPIN